MVTVDEISRTTMRPRVRWIFYNPYLGRFISEDPKGYEGEDDNFYRYVGNNPLAFKDPSGEIALSTILAVVGVIVFYGAVQQFDAEADLISSLTTQIENFENLIESLKIRLKKLRNKECKDREIRRLKRQLAVAKSFIVQAKGQVRLAKLRQASIVFDIVATLPKPLNGIESYLFSLFQKFSK